MGHPREVQELGCVERDGIQLELGGGPLPLTALSQQSGGESRVELQRGVLRQGKQGINGGFGFCPASLSSGSASVTHSSCQRLVSRLLAGGNQLFRLFILLTTSPRIHYTQWPKKY